MLLEDASGRRPRRGTAGLRSSMSGIGGGTPGSRWQPVPERPVALLEAERRKCEFLGRRPGLPGPARRLGSCRGAAGRAVARPCCRKGSRASPTAVGRTLPLVPECGRSGACGSARPRITTGSPRSRIGLRELRSLPLRFRFSSEDRPDTTRISAAARGGTQATARMRPASAHATTLNDVPAGYRASESKGGVGKTTTARWIFAACLARPASTVLIDLDPQANATSGLGCTANGSSTPICSTALRSSRL